MSYNEGMRRGGWILLLAFLVIGGGAALRGCGLVGFAFSAFKPGTEESILIEVTPGTRPLALALHLEEKGIVKDGEEFHFLGRLIRQWSGLKAGEYRLGPAMTPIEIFATITSGISSGRRVVVREGWNMYQVADAVAAEGLAERPRLIALARDRTFMNSVGITDPKVPSLEGYLFPETYLFTRSMGPEKILRTMVEHFKAAWTPEIAARAQRMGLSQHQVVTLASVIEKETGAPQERRLISSVFHNRLKKRMRLQSDPTTIYGIWETFNGNLTRKDLQQRTEYNTYKIPGLPIGAISNPGREALAAAVDPQASEHLFFVSKNDGTHVFTRNLAEHEAAVRAFQKNAKAREGKSWRDLKGGTKKSRPPDGSGGAS
ncbi:MAG: endolytic transglycosylase MltG [Bdellovibrionales bacterium]|nr:endolytic transglycosylase MltG [Bdellovibrionales bacterium]